jgi:hypothetical protein
VTKAIDKEFVRQRDDELIAQGLKLHQRPFHVAMAWMTSEGISGNVFDKAMWDPLMAIYHALYPAGDFSMPAMLKGGVALRDQMYPVRVSVAYGTVSVNPIDCIEISREELELIFKHYPEQGWRAFMASPTCGISLMALAICRMGPGMRRSFSPTRTRPSRRPLVSSPVTSILTRPYRQSA